MLLSKHNKNFKKATYTLPLYFYKDSIFISSIVRVMEELDEKDFAKMFGKHVKMLRKQHELSQSELAGRAELEKTAIQRIERGYNSTLKTLRKLAKGFGISLSDLFKLD